MARRATIVGAGIGGLSTAIGLHRAGWSVTVLERWPEVVGLGAALGVWPQAQSELADLGIGADFQRLSVPAAGAVGLFRRDGRPLLQLAAGSRRAPDVRLISRPKLMDVLRQAAGDVELRTGVSADDTALRATLDDCDVLIGADGLRSSVRNTFFGSRTKPRYSGMVGWRGAIDGELDSYGETWGDGALFGRTPMEPGRTNFYAALPAAEDDPGTFAQVREFSASWHDPIPAVLAAADSERVLRHPIYDLHPPLPSFARGHVALLGDAAHAMTPNLGRGACEAISDAVALVGHLANTDDVATALRGYDRQRRRPAQRVAARSWRAMSVTRSRALAPVRDGLVRAAALVVR